MRRSVLSEKPEVIQGGLDVFPFGKRRIMIYRDVTKHNIISICRLRRPEEATLAGGRFSRMTGEQYENVVSLDIPHGYGVGPDVEDAQGMSELFDWIDEDTVGGWSLYYGKKRFTPAQMGLLPGFGKITFPYPVFMFEDAAAAVKLKLLRG